MVSTAGCGVSRETLLFFTQSLLRSFADIYLRRWVQPILYGALENTPYKWLDLSSLFCQILNSNPSNLKIKYFTSRVSPRDDDLSKPQRQDVYLRALRTYCLNIEIYFGKFVTHPKRLPLADNIDQMVNVLRTEEKGSDVNLAVHLLNDAWLNKYDCGIVVSNDGDLSEAMRLVREERRIKLGLLTPGSSHRVRVSYQLRQHADFHKYIGIKLLKKNQLPSPIPKTKIHKPPRWKNTH